MFYNQDMCCFVGHIKSISFSLLKIQIKRPKKDRKFLSVNVGAIVSERLDRQVYYFTSADTLTERDLVPTLATKTSKFSRDIFKKCKQMTVNHQSM